METLKDKCAIVGIGQTPFLLDSGRTELSFALEAIKLAIEDAGLTSKDIDGFVSYTLDTSASDAILANNLGTPDIAYAGQLPHAGGSGCGMVAHACAAVMAGLADYVVCWRALTDSNFTSNRMQRLAVHQPFSRDADDFLRPFGWTLSTMEAFAMACRRHMYEYGTTIEQIATIPITARKYAARNPRALRRDPLTVEEYMSWPIAVDPIRQFERSAIADVGGACVVTSAERAKACRHRPVYVMAAGQGSGPLPGATYEMWNHRPVITETAAKYLAPRLYNMAGVRPEDIDVAELYDCFPFTCLALIEDYGFCAKGEGGAFIQDGRIELGGQLPLNTHGGHQAEGYIHGFSHVLEGVRQLRGTSTAQVEDAELVLVGSAWTCPTSGLILRR